MNYFLYGKEILKKLIENGFEAYFVGGVVRDKILELPIHDIDITTSALPSDIQRIFDKTNLDGIKYNSITIILNEYKYEVTTFRKDIEYTNHRHPVVGVAKTLEEDLVRRDFTINALAMDINENIIDKFNGLEDLNNKVIRAIGDANKRFDEDSLRILRCFYFVSKLGFDIDKKTLDGINLNANLIINLSNQRLMQEIYKIIRNKHSLKAFKAISDSNVINYIKGLEKGIKHIVTNNLIIDDIILFYALCFRLNDSIPVDYNFTKDNYTKIKKIIELSLVTEDGNFNKLILYSYGLEICKYANKVNYLLHFSNNIEDVITHNYNNLPIKKTCDLAFKGQDIIMMTNNMNAKWIGNIIERIKYEILINDLENDYNVIKNFVIDNGLLNE